MNKLREAEILISQGATSVEASRKIGVTEQTYYRWRKEYGGMRIEQAKRLNDLEKENTRLKKLVASGLSLDDVDTAVEPAPPSFILVAGGLDPKGTNDGYYIEAVFKPVKGIDNKDNGS